MMSARTKALRAPCLLALVCALLGGCAFTHPPAETKGGARLTPDTTATRDLLHLPEPKGKVVAAVYAFRDQTGQYKPAPDSSFSAAVTQGGAAMLVKALGDSGWFTVVERENLQNLLTERKIVRALELPSDKAAPAINIPQLLPASILIEGGIIGYESNVRTGGIGANYLGVGLSTQYRVDQVTVSLRSVDVRTGQIIDSLATTKTIYSYEVRPTVFKFVNFKDLVQFEAGITRNEPAQLCVQEAIEAAVAHLVAKGLKEGVWALKDDKDWSSPTLLRYLGTLDGDRGAGHAQRQAAAASRTDDTNGMKPDAAAASTAPPSPPATQQAALAPPSEGGGIP
jgi:curli production assembly/transport component CsgG